MIQSSPSEKLEIDVQWALNYSQAPVPPIRFTKGFIDILYGAAEALREGQPASTLSSKDLFLSSHETKVLLKGWLP